LVQTPFLVVGLGKYLFLVECEMGFGDQEDHFNLGQVQLDVRIP